MKAYTLSIKAGDDAQDAYDKEQADSANAPPISSDQISQIEKWLGVVAHEYERLGFKVPDYTDIDTSNKKCTFPLVAPSSIMSRILHIHG